MFVPVPPQTDQREDPVFTRSSQPSKKVFFNRLQQRNNATGAQVRSCSRQLLIIMVTCLQRLLTRTLLTGGYVPTDKCRECDLLMANAFPSPSMLRDLKPGCVLNHFPRSQVNQTNHLYTLTANSTWLGTHTQASLNSKPSKLYAYGLQQ